MDAATANATALLHAHQDWIFANEERILETIEEPLSLYYEPYELICNDTYPTIAPGAAGYEEAFTDMICAAMAKRMQDDHDQYRTEYKKDARAKRRTRKAKFAAAGANKRARA